MINTDNIDKFGHCVICHKYLLIKKVVDGKVVDMFLPTYSDTTFLLNTGSQMQVTVCKDCKAITDLTDPKVISDIKDAVDKGWDLETKLKVASGEMTEVERKKILDTADALTIDCHSENMDKYAVQQRQIELLKINIEELSSELIEVKK